MSKETTEAYKAGFEQGKAEERQRVLEWCSARGWEQENENASYHKCLADLREHLTTKHHE